MLLLRVALFVVLAAGTSSAHAQVPPAPRAVPGVLTLPRAAPPPHIAARELQLEGHLRALGAQAKYSGWLGGAVITMGCAAVAIGAAYPREAGALLFPLGALALSRGVLGITLMAGREQQAAAYRSLPTYTPDQVRARLAFGEAVLAYQARRARIGRIVDGSVSLLVAASYVPLLWWLQRRDNPAYHFNDDGFGYAVLALSVVNAGTALVTLFSESGAEQRYDAYKQLVDRQEREHPGELVRWTSAVSLRPLVTRTAIGVQSHYQF
ncbi:MAG: hypothetical protein RLZZ450_2826 [Pseudomonadota bacterium]|jgi:hypothetical protein